MPPLANDRCYAYGFNIRKVLLMRNTKLYCSFFVVLILVFILIGYYAPTGIVGAYDAGYQTEELAEFDSSNMFVVIKVNDNQESFTIQNYANEELTDVFLISTDDSIFQRPVVKGDYIYYNSMHIQSGIFEFMPNRFYEDRLYCHSVLYHLSSDGIFQISNKEQKNKIILDVFEYKGDCYILYENGLFKDGECILKINVIDNTPLRSTGVLDGNTYIFPTFKGVMSYNFDTNKIEVLMELNLGKSDFAQIIWSGDYYYFVVEYISEYEYYFDKNAQTTIEKFDKEFNLIHSKTMNSGIDTLCIGKSGFTKTYLVQNADLDYVVTSEYIEFEDIASRSLPEYIIKNPDPDLLFTEVDDKCTPVWSYDEAAHRFMMIDPYEATIISSFDG